MIYPALYIKGLQFLHPDECGITGRKPLGLTTSALRD